MEGEERKISETKELERMKAGRQEEGMWKIKALTEGETMIEGAKENI